MFYVFNDQSLIPIETREEADQLLAQFAKTCDAARRIGFSQIKSLEAFKGYELMPGLTFGTVLDQPNSLSREIITLLKSIISKTLLITEDDFKNEETPIAEYYLLSDKPHIHSPAFSVARLYGDEGTLMVSLLTANKWDSDTLHIIKFFIDEKYNSESESHQIPHASRTVHIESRKEFYSKLLSSPSELKNWVPAKTKFPRIAISTGLYWDEFTANIVKSAGGDRIALIQETANKIANANGYRYNQILSSINSRRHGALRIIYEAGKKRDKIYLSVDMETGGFEVCDFSGAHLGEYKFNGELNKDKDPGHGIYLSY